MLWCELNEVCVKCMPAKQWYQMATQATNKTTDPSDVVMKNTRHHQTTTEVEEEHKAKATSKTNLEVAKQQHISHTA